MARLMLVGMLVLAVAASASADWVAECAVNCGGEDWVKQATSSDGLLDSCECRPKVDEYVRHNCWGDPTCGMKCEDGSTPECKGMRGKAVEGIITCRCANGAILTK